MRVRYNQGDDIIEITVKDASGAKVEVRRANKGDSSELGRMLTWLIQKHGCSFKMHKGVLDLDNEFIKF